MHDLLEIALAAGTLLSLVLHYLGRRHPVLEKVADAVDDAEDVASGLKDKH
jgi:hypothetical protein